MGDNETQETSVMELDDLASSKISVYSTRTHNYVSSANEIVSPTNPPLASTLATRPATSLAIIFTLYFALVTCYTLFGAAIFHYLERDSENLNQTRESQKVRCSAQRAKLFRQVDGCFARSFDNASCVQELNGLIGALDECYREQIASELYLTSFAAALVFCLTICTTVGYGHAAAVTVPARVFFYFYAAVGIPLFFALEKEVGKLLVQHYYHLQRVICRACLRIRNRIVPASTTDATVSPVARSVATTTSFVEKIWIYRRIIFVAVPINLVYILLLGAVVDRLEETFDYFTSVYFVFQSATLIGFGDVFPSQVWKMLLACVLMIPGIFLTHICLFSLQEEVRELVAWLAVGLMSIKNCRLRCSRS